MRCTCEQAAREAWDAALEEAAQWCGEQRKLWMREYRKGYDMGGAMAKAGSYSAAETHLRSMKRPPIKGERSPWER